MDDRKIEELIRMLKNGDWKARENAAKALGETADTRAVEPLIRALGDSSSDVMRRAAVALGKIGDACAVEPLIRLLGDENSYVAAEALGKIGDARAIEPLIRLLGDENSYVAAEVLGKIGDARAIEPLIKALGDKNSYIRRRAAAEALDKLHWSPANETEKAYYLVAKQDWISVIQLGVPAVEPLIRLLGDSASNTRGSAAAVLGEIGDTRAVEPLIRVLVDSDSDVRENVAEALGKIDDARAIEPLIKALGDGNSYVRKGAAEALDKLHWSPANETEKVYYLTAKQDWESVILLGTPAVEPLTRLLGDKDSNIKNKTIELLEKIFPQITEIIFGETSSNNSKTCIKNLETSQLTIPMSSLTKININAETHNFDMVERFITYAINYVGQKHLRKKVEVYIHGNPDKLHPNLLNSFRNLCRKVIVQGKE